MWVPYLFGSIEKVGTPKSHSTVLILESYSFGPQIFNKYVYRAHYDFQYILQHIFHYKDFHS